MRTTYATLAVFLFALNTLSAAGEKRERFLFYKVERIDKTAAPKIDGKLDEDVWKDKAEISTLRNFHGPRAGEFASQKSVFVLLTDGAKLYIGATFYDEDMNALTFDPSKAPFWNDCTEIYFDPLHDGAEHIQLVVDCGGRKWWHKKFDRGYGWWDDNAWYLLAQWRAASARHEDRWTIEIEIDCASFNIDPAPGKVTGFNPCRFRLVPGKHEFSAWGFTPDVSKKQKDMAAWGHLVFGKPGEKMKDAELTADDIRLVYPDLAGRILEYPVDDGLILYGADGAVRKSFAKLLEAPLAKLKERADKLANALDGLREGKDFGNLQGETDKLAAEREQIVKTFAAGIASLGGYDKLMRDIELLTERMDAWYWKLKIFELARK